MRVIIQRVSNANVGVDKKIIGEIQKGFLVLLGVGPDDDKEDISYLVRKITNMRIFEDENGKMNRSILDVGGSILVISQFTLFADCRKGNRPSFTSAGAPEMSKQLYFDFIDALTESGIHTEKGSFGADMDVSLINQGPVTIFLDSKDR